jgi:lactate racemase
VQITLPYNDAVLQATLDWAEVLRTLRIAEVPALDSPEAALLSGLRSPIGGRPLDQSLRSDGKILVIVSDSFRKTGVHLLLPTLVTFLNENGVSDAQISFLFATGSHRSPTVSEQKSILGAEIYRRFQRRVVVHTTDEAGILSYRGTTSRGTPVYINRLAEEADTVISTGTVVLHYFGGFGGGRKSIVPGIAGLQTIAANHALNLDPTEDQLNPNVAIGQLSGNPVAEDMLEGAKLAKVDFLINTVLDRNGQIASLYCGELELAHEAACIQARKLFAVPIAEKANFVVASAGSAKNFVQSHKSLYNAFQTVEENGPIILVAPATEGYGGDRFSNWLKLGNPRAIIAELRKNAEINGQTALSTVEKARNAQLVTDLSATEVEKLGARKADSLEIALDRLRAHFVQAGIERPTCYIMPDASYSVPFMG